MTRSKGKTIFSLVLLILAYAAYAVGIFFLLKGEDGEVDGALWGAIMVILFAVAGTISHFMLGHFGDCNKFEKALFIISWPPFSVAWLMILLGSYIIYAIGLIFDKDWSFGAKKKTTETVYVVRDEAGFERELKFYERGQTYGQTRDESLPYNRFKDDLGNFWRSYDGEKNFVRERPGQQPYEL